jgi:hypothetical protein
MGAFSARVGGMNLPEGMAPRSKRPFQVALSPLYLEYLGFCPPAPALRPRPSPTGTTLRPHSPPIPKGGPEPPQKPAPAGDNRGRFQFQLRPRG